jgi:hypothetical protein
VVRARRVRHQTQRAPAHHPLPFASRRDALTTAAGVLLLTAAGSTNTQPAQAAAAAPAPVRKPFCGVVERPPSWAYTAPWQVRRGRCRVCGVRGAPAVLVHGTPWHAAVTPLWQ